MANDIKINIDLVVDGLNKAIGGIKGVGTSAKSLGKIKLPSLTSAFKTLSIGITGVNQGIELAKKGFSLLTGVIGKFVRESIKVEDITAQFKVLTGSIDSARILIRDLQEFSARTPFQLQGLAEASRTLLAFGFQQTEVIDRLQTLGDAAAATGSSIQEIALIFGQVQAAGKLTGERFLQLAERGINVGPAIAKSMGVSETALVDLRAQGKITFDIFDKAFKELTSEGGKFFGGMIEKSKTLSGVLSTLDDNFKLLLADIGDLFLPILKDASKELIIFIQQNKELIKVKSIQYMKELVKGFSNLLKGAGKLAPVFFGIANSLDILSLAALKARLVSAKLQQQSVATATLNLKTDAFADTIAYLEEKIKKLDGTLEENAQKYIDFQNITEKASEKTKKFSEELKKVPKKVIVDIKAEVPEIEASLSNAFKRASTVMVATVKKGLLGISGYLKSEEGGKQFSGAVNTVASGGESVKGAVSSGLMQSGNPIAMIVGAAIKVFGKTEEAFKKWMEGLLKVGKELPKQFATNFPLFIKGLLAAIPQLLQAVIDFMPTLIDNLLLMIQDESFWRDISRVAGTSFVVQLVKQMADPFFQTRMTVAIVKAVVKGIPVMIDEATKEFKEVFNDLSKGIKNAVDAFHGVVGFFASIINVFEGLINRVKSIFSGGDIAKNIGGGVGDFVSGVGDLLGFANGGMIPAAAGQAMPILAHGGENVIDRSLNNRIDNMVTAFERGDLGSGSSQPLTINLQVGEKQLAETILDLNQKGFRLA